MVRYAMALDTRRCFGCQTCAVACKMANNMPKGIVYNRVITQGGASIDTASGSYPHCLLEYLPYQCQHCESPACLTACPTGATRQRDDGIVWVDSELCIGCAACIDSCPYDGVRTLLNSAPEYYLDVVVGEADAPKHRGGTVEKCTFCYNLVDRGEAPACMQLCPGRARYWGDLDDPESDISKVLEGRAYVLLGEEAGTNPKVYYLK
ncbi:MAG: 4Fe-4S dicluster domain-containing protein [Slackia sp.]|nr:4Fe-4S dicluster domain-containing protein [Slackia sp.]